MKRLFVFGCSYTFYMWPTWGDLLSVDYDYYENWGFAGLGNRAILERLIEAHTKNNFTKDDTVIVQWSTHLRHDWHNEKFITGKFNGWQTHGNVFSGVNALNYDKKWYDRFFSERSWLMHTLNFVSLAQKMLDAIGCEWRMTSMGDLRKLGGDLESQTLGYEKVTVKEEEKIKEFPAWERYPEFKIYEDTIWNNYKNKWVPEINPTIQDYKKEQWVFQAAHDKKPWVDGHPTTLQHARWLNTFLRPSLKLSDDVLTKQQDIVDEFIKIKANPEFMDCLKLENYLMNYDGKSTLKVPHLSWPPKRRGF